MVEIKQVYMEIMRELATLDTRVAAKELERLSL